jgi:hypothetical protein
MNPLNPDLQYRGKDSKAIPSDYEPGVLQEVCLSDGISIGFMEFQVLGPSEWWYEFWRDIRLRDLERAATVDGPKGTT